MCSASKRSVWEEVFGRRGIMTWEPEREFRSEMSGVMLVDLRRENRKVPADLYASAVPLVQLKNEQSLHDTRSRLDRRQNPPDVW
jgi:hypothetical protein